MRVVNFPSSYNKQCANLEERSLRFEEAALLGTFYTREVVLLVCEYWRGRRQVETRWVSGTMRQSLGGGGGGGLLGGRLAGKRGSLLPAAKMYMWLLPSRVSGVLA